jgi:hypothetical protein
MLDRYGDDQPTPAERAEAIRSCDLCDRDGYRGGTVCSHVDYASAAKRGMAMIRHAMGWQR